MIRVGVVDDHPIARRGVEHLLHETGRVKVVAAAGSLGELAAAMEAAESPADFDVIVLDLYHDGGAPCLDAVARLAGSSRVLVMSASGQPKDVMGAIRAGASGYITKHADDAMFVAAVETVAAGGFALSAPLADILQAELGPSAAAGPVKGRQPSGARQAELSAREEETLNLIASGFTHAQVATRMGVSKATVETYVERIRAKLQIGNKAQLTRAALERLGGTGPV
ncbi:response regulator transcription factor [Microbispora corallina]|uniref:DNA-binding response regulator n=1 Tax=Microbispora corallina TaxID=83302 RepID=A0ABQ4G130_9ACTN|nr:response regulator transcription factor [Microbispora corallina]GIH40770.1 DNA-binding response regulator [Microbispora corallina]